MAPESQTLFSLTLFLALSSLLAWSNRRNRTPHQLRDPAPAALVRNEEPAKTA